MKNTKEFVDWCDSMGNELDSIATAIGLAMELNVRNFDGLDKILEELDDREVREIFDSLIEFEELVNDALEKIQEIRDNVQDYVQEHEEE